MSQPQNEKCIQAPLQSWQQPEDQPLHPMHDIFGFINTWKKLNQNEGLADHFKVILNVSNSAVNYISKC